MTARPRNYARNKWTAYLRATGRPVMVPAGPARAWVRKLHDMYAMSWKDIAAATGGRVSLGTVSGLNVGTQREVHLTTRDLLLAVRPPMTVEYRPGQGPHGALVDYTGSMRRVRALAAVGFPYTDQARLMGVPARGVQYLVSPKQETRQGRKQVPATLARAIADLYDKVQDADPAAYGVDPVLSSRAVQMAARRRFAPPITWDSDTLDDPAGFPEWTGYCGTLTGRTRHQRMGTPVCPACAAAHNARRRARTAEKEGV